MNEHEWLQEFWANLGEPGRIVPVRPTARRATFGYTMHTPPGIVDVESLFEPDVTSADHAFELFVKGELSEKRYLYWKLHFKKLVLTPEQQRIERIRSMPKMKQRFTRLKPWE